MSAARTPTSAGQIAGWRALGLLYNALMTGVVLSLVTRRGPDVAREFVFRHFRRQHLEKFLPGLKKLGIADEPPAAACALYHFHSNALGGVKTEYLRESDRKVWVRYPPPRWIWRGTAICGVPTEVNVAMLYGWHGHNGESLGEPRLGWVCTGVTTDGDPGLEGYYYLYDRPLAEHERVRFARDERMPALPPGSQPSLPTDDWPEERLQRTHRTYAVEYLRSMLPTLQEQLGAEDARTEIGRAARLIGLQLYDDVAALVPHADGLDLLRKLLEAHGEAVDRRGEALVQTGWRTLDGVALPDPAGAFLAWSELFAGLVAARDRFERLSVERPGGADAVWRIGR